MSQSNLKINKYVITNKIFGNSLQKAQYFSGNPLDRSFTGKKDGIFLQKCMEMENTIFIFSDSGKLLCSKIENDFSLNSSSLVFVRLDVVRKFLETDDLSSIIAKYNVVLLGSESESGWCVAIDPHIRNDTTFMSRIIETFSSFGFETSSLVLVNGRTLLQSSSITDAAIGGQALAILSFHENNKFDSISGTETRSIEAGAKRESISTKRKTYPRTDSVAIACVVSPDGQKCLLGRNKGYPKGFYTCLSGFIEQCETIQEAVRREVWEEAGVRIGAVTILDSQPWPIGRSGGCELMIGCIARAITPEININQTEMDDVRWFTREQARSMLGNSSLNFTQQRPEGTIFIPSERAIAHHLIKEFVEITPQFRFFLDNNDFSVVTSRSIFPTVLTAGVGGFAIGLCFSFIILKAILLKKL